MTRRAAAACGALGLTLALAGCRPTPSEEADQRLARLRAEHDRLHAAFDEKVARDPVVTEALAHEGDVVLAFREELLQGTMREVAQRYLDRVELDLPLEKTVRVDGEVRVKTPLGRLDAGTWTLDLTIHRVRGVLRAHTPEVALPSGDRIGLSLPVSLERARGLATAHFTWDARGVANLACRDFTVTRSLEGEGVPERYTLQGALRLTASGGELQARPEFARRSFRLRVELTPSSWAVVQAALDEQDQLLKCGLGLDPEEVLAKLRALLARGFDVPLPRAVFRTVTLPAGLQQKVAVGERRLMAQVDTRGLGLSQGALWYGVSASVVPAPGAPPP